MAIGEVLDATLAQSFGLRLLTPLPPQALKGHGPQRCMGNFKPQELANTAWALATFSQADAQLFTVLAREAERHLGDLPSGARQHSMGVSDVGPGGCAAVHGVGEGSRAAPGRLQPVGSC